MLKSCGFKFNGCFCDSKGKSRDPQGNECKADQCHGDITYPEYYQCEMVSNITVDFEISLLPSNFTCEDFEFKL